MHWGGECAQLTRSSQLAAWWVPPHVLIIRALWPLPQFERIRVVGGVRCRMRQSGDDEGGFQNFDAPLPGNVLSDISLYCLVLYARHIDEATFADNPLVAASRQVGCISGAHVALGAVLHSYVHLSTENCTPRCADWQPSVPARVMTPHL